MWPHFAIICRLLFLAVAAVIKPYPSCSDTKVKRTNVPCSSPTISCMSCSNNEKTGNGTGTHIVVAQRQLQRTPAGKRYSAAHTLGYFLSSRIQPAMCHLRSPDHPPFQTQTHAHMTRRKNTRPTIQSNPWIHTLAEVPRCSKWLRWMYVCFPACTSACACVCVIWELS